MFTIAALIKTTLHKYKQKNGRSWVDFKHKSVMRAQGRIQDLNEGGGQDFLGTKNRAAYEIFVRLKRLKKSQN